MTVNIMQLTTDEAGNIGWVTVNVIPYDSSTIQNYIDDLALDGNGYAAEIVKGDNFDRVAQAGTVII